MPPYLDPLHAPVPLEFHSQYTSLSYANPPLEPPFQTTLPPSFSRVPQTPPSKLVSSPRHVPIMFELIGAPSRGLGIPMRELVVRSGCALKRMIVDANERVGPLMRSSPEIREVSLRIMWPGYDHLNWSHSLDLVSSTGSVMRGQLAVQIAFAFSAYMMQMEARTPSSSVGNWRLGDGGIAFERLILTALWNVCGDHWMAEIYVDCR